MKDLEKEIDLFISKVKNEHITSVKGGIIDTLIKPLCEGEFALEVSSEKLIAAICMDKSIAHGIFERHFMKTNLRFKVLYNGDDVTTYKMKEQIPSLLNILHENVYTSIEKINKHLFDSIEHVKNTYKHNNKTLNPKIITQLNSGKYFDISFNGTNATTNVRPILDELVKLDPKLTYIKVPKKGFNNEMINAYL
jgi:hypothetical protein|tara:strand:+ start:20 stop:601 length:582 start_codon:yes stop_codon:yes gene_type:complete